MGLPAIESVRRGVLNLRANWELVLVQWVGTMAVLALALLGLVPPLLVLGLGSLSALRGRPDEWPGALPELVERLREAAAPLVASLVGTLAVWTLAFVVSCYFQAGTYGVLVNADRQAPAGAGGDWRWFRTWSGRDFNGWAGRFLWRFFWLANFYFLLASLLLLASAVLLGGALLGAQRWGWPAGVGIGCGGALPLLFLGVVLVLWVALAQADLARDGSGVGRASRTGMRVLGRRLGGVLLIALLFAAAASSVAMVFAPFSLGSDLMLRDAPAASLVVSLLLGAVQALVSSALGVVLAGSLVALVRAEVPERGDPRGAG
jgi:hypothetical protein